MKFSDEEIRNLFGNEAAEDERIERLKEYYVKSDAYESMKSDIPLYILVGHKGTGKSALLSVLKAEQQSQNSIIISIQPDDISRINQKEDDFLEMIRMWKTGLSDIIFKKLMISVEEVIEKDSWAQKVSELALSIIGTKVGNWEKEKIGDKDFAKLIKNTVFHEKKILVLIDDLDRGWKNTETDIARISALLNAVRDLSRDMTNLQFRIAIRSDVYYAVRTSDESTDKIEGSVVWIRWTNHEILVMLIKRIETARGNQVDEESLLKKHQSELQRYLFDIFEERFQGHGHWENVPMYKVLMSLIRKRPRDLIKLCTLSAKKAKERGHSRIMTADLEAIFKEYSVGRLQDTINEYSSEFPRIEDLLLKMKPTRKEVDEGHPCLYERGKLTTKLANIIGQSSYTFSNRKTQVTANSLAAFLYKINFLTARKDTDNGTGIQRLYYDENKYILNEFTDFGYKYEIHPAYRWALQPDDVGQLFNQIDLADE